MALSIKCDGQFNPIIHYLFVKERFQIISEAIRTASLPHNLSRLERNLKHEEFVRQSLAREAFLYRLQSTQENASRKKALVRMSEVNSIRRTACVPEVSRFIKPTTQDFLNPMGFDLVLKCDASLRTDFVNNHSKYGYVFTTDENPNKQNLDLKNIHLLSRQIQKLRIRRRYKLVSEYVKRIIGVNMESMNSFDEWSSDISHESGTEDSICSQSNKCIKSHWDYELKTSDIESVSKIFWNCSKENEKKKYREVAGTIYIPTSQTSHQKKLLPIGSRLFSSYTDTQDKICSSHDIFASNSDHIDPTISSWSTDKKLKGTETNANADKFSNHENSVSPENLEFLKTCPINQFKGNCKDKELVNSIRQGLRLQTPVDDLRELLAMESPYKCCYQKKHEFDWFEKMDLTFISTIDECVLKQDIKHKLIETAQDMLSTDDADLEINIHLPKEIIEEL